VKRLIERVLLDHGCSGKNTIVAGGEQGADPHEQGHGPLLARRPIVIDIFPQHTRSGYWGDLTRTVVRGAAGHELRRMYAAVRAAQAAALAKIRAGARCSAVHKAAAEELAGRGFETGARNGRPAGFIHSTGHGVGLAIHEAPSVSRFGGRLEAGNVITVEPGLYYPGLGGIRIEDTVEVTKTGWRYVVPCEKRFEILDGTRQ
jgi:Xaa-Pro aminopeptidase